jgi:hypothetical protein
VAERSANGAAGNLQGHSLLTAVKLTVTIPFYDDLDEASRMVTSVHQSLDNQIEVEYLLVDLRGDWKEPFSKAEFGCAVRLGRARNLPAAKNQAAGMAGGEFILFLYPGLFPSGNAIQTMVDHLQGQPEVSAVAGRWFNASGKLEIGYNVRRFPTLPALLLDILLLNKLIPRNRTTRRYKMHDFNHEVRIRAEHANDCALMFRREALLKYGGFDEAYPPGWFDQVEFCQEMYRAGARIDYEPSARFISNEKVPLIDRLVCDYYVEYRAAECLYIRKHFGVWAAAIAHAATAAGMVFRIGFSMIVPRRGRNWLLSRLRSYVDDDYVRNLRSAYWVVLKRTVWGPR